MTPTDEKHQRNTFLMLMALGGVGGAWESWTIANPAFGDTFSAVIRKLAEGQPFISVMFGMVCGHLFWSNPWTRWAVILGFIMGAIFWWLTDGQEKKEKAQEIAAMEAATA